MSTKSAHIAHVLLFLRNSYPLKWFIFYRLRLNFYIGQVDQFKFFIGPAGPFNFLKFNLCTFILFLSVRPVLIVCKFSFILFIWPADLPCKDLGPILGSCKRVVCWEWADPLSWDLQMFPGLMSMAWTARNVFPCQKFIKISPFITFIKNLFGRKLRHLESQEKPILFFFFF